MVFVILAILSLSILLAALFLRDGEGHPPAEYIASGWRHLNLSAALREVCQGVLTPKTLLFLGENAPAKITTAFGREQLRLAPLFPIFLRERGACFFWACARSDGWGLASCGQ